MNVRHPFGREPENHQERVNITSSIKFAQFSRFTHLNQDIYPKHPILFGLVPLVIVMLIQGRRTSYCACQGFLEAWSTVQAESCALIDSNHPALGWIVDGQTVALGSEELAL